MTAFEVVVVGGTAAGVCAAVAAACGGAQTLLLEAGRHLGGMVSGGLGYTDVGDVRVLGGLAAEFRRGDDAGRTGGPRAARRGVRRTAGDQARAALDAVGRLAVRG